MTTKQYFSSENTRYNKTLRAEWQLLRRAERYAGVGQEVRESKDGGGEDEEGPYNSTVFIHDRHTMDVVGLVVRS